MSFDKLTLHTEKHPTEINLFTVWWMWGEYKQGIINVRLNDESIERKEIVAELCAMHHLLEVESIGGVTRGGNNMKIYPSYGAIKKLQLGTCKIHELLPYGSFLKCRFRDAEIEIKKTDDFIKPRSEQRLVEIQALESLGSVMVCKDEYFKLSWHALNRLMTRWNQGSELEAWRYASLLFKDAHEYVKTQSKNDAERYFYNRGHKTLFIAKDSVIVTAYHGPNEREFILKT